MTVSTMILVLIVAYNELIVSKRLAQCIYYGSCNEESTLPELPSYIQPYGKLWISETDSTTPIDNQCKVLLNTTMNRWTSIEVDNDVCNVYSNNVLIRSNWNITNYPLLESLKVGRNSLIRLNSLIISNNELLETFETTSADESSTYGSFGRIQNLFISSM